MVQIVEHFLGAFAAIFPMVNPFSTMALFLSLASGMSAPEQRYQALKASIIAAVIMLLVLYIGAVILHFFGISIGALRVTGGLIVAYIGFRILFPDATPAPDSTRQQEGRFGSGFRIHAAGIPQPRRARDDGGGHEHDNPRQGSAGY
jgi:multiple antibiotic resistance protein